jgi:hypothetical protein
LFLLSDILSSEPIVPTPTILGTGELLKMKKVLMKCVHETTMGE